jgi:hypothetical protein
LRQERSRKQSQENRKVTVEVVPALRESVEMEAPVTIAV